MKWVVLLCACLACADALHATRPIITKKIAKPAAEPLKPRQQAKLCHAQNSNSACSSQACLWCEGKALTSTCIHPLELYRIPKNVYTCSGNKEVVAAAQKAAAGRANPSDPCEGKDQKACDALDECTWCKSAAVPSSCYTRAQAKFLPAAVFSCDKPVPSVQQRRERRKAAGSGAATRSRRRAGSPA